MIVLVVLCVWQYGKNHGSDSNMCSHEETKDLQNKIHGFTFSKYY